MALFKLYVASKLKIVFWVRHSSFMGQSPEYTQHTFTRFNFVNVWLCSEWLCFIGLILLVLIRQSRLLLDTIALRSSFLFWKIKQVKLFIACFLFPLTSCCWYVHGCICCTMYFVYLFYSRISILKCSSLSFFATVLLFLLTCSIFNPN